MYRVCTCSATSTHIITHMYIHRNLARAPLYVRLGPCRLNTAPSDLSPHVYMCTCIALHVHTLYSRDTSSKYQHRISWYDGTSIAYALTQLRHEWRSWVRVHVYTPYTQEMFYPSTNISSRNIQCMGSLRIVGSFKVSVSFAEYSLVYRALSQEWPMISRSLLIVATPQYVMTQIPHVHAVRYSTSTTCTCSVLYW